MNILITGVAGQIGSNLAHHLLSLNHSIIGIDNLSSSPLPPYLKSFPNFSFIHHDITSPIILNNIDLIYNLACPASPLHYQTKPIHTINTSIQGSINILNLANHCNCPCVFSSTSEIYGDPLIHPQSESYNGNVSTTSPRSCYDESKRLAETIHYEFHKLYNTNIKIIRIFNTFAPNILPSDGRAIPSFVFSAIHHNPLTIFGNGSQTRSFLYINDLISAITSPLFLNLPNNLPIINLGNPHEISILNLANRIIKLSNSNSSLSFHPLPLNDPIQRKPNINLAKSLLHWKPTTSLNSALKYIISYYKSHYYKPSLVAYSSL